MFRELNEERELSNLTQTPAQKSPPPHSCTTNYRRSQQVRRGSKSQLRVDLIDRGQRRGLGCCWVLAASIQLLISIQNSCQTSNSVPFKTSFVSSSDYSIRRNGALLSVPNVEQIQRDQADSLISPPAFEPTVDEENFALMSRELSRLQREEAQQNDQNGDKRQQQVDTSEQRHGDISGPTRGHSYLQVLDDLVAAPSAQTNTGQVESANGTSGAQEAAAKPEPLVQQTTLPPQAASSSAPPTTTAAQSVSSTTTTTTTTTTSTAAPVTTTITPPAATTTTIVPTTRSTETSVAPSTVTTTTSDAYPSAEHRSPNEATSNSTTITVQPVEIVSITTTEAPPEERAPSTTREPISSPAPETISRSNPITNSTSFTQADIKHSDNSPTDDLRPIIDNSGNTSATSNSSSGINTNQETDNKQADGGTNTTATTDREARGRELVCRFGELNCSYVVATIPVVDKWKPETGNKTGASVTRVINEFVFVPEDSGLSFEDTGYSTRRPDSKESETVTLKAEHRTIDGEGDIELGPVPAEPTGETDDVELDYILSDTESFSGKSAVGPPTLRSSNTSGQQLANSGQRIVTPPTTTEARVASTAPTTFSSIRQPGTSTPTTLKPSLESSSSTLQISLKSIEGSLTNENNPATEAVTTTTTIKPTVRVSTSQSTSFSVRASGPATSSGIVQQTTEQTSRPPELTSTTPAPTSSSTRRSTAARPNQKLMRIGEQSLPARMEAKTVAPQASATNTVSSVTSPAPTASTLALVARSTSVLVVSSTTKRPATFDWRRGETRGNRHPKSSRLSQHRQFFSEPAGDLRRRPVGQANYANVDSSEDSEEDEAAKILTRYTITSQLSRLSAAGSPAEIAGDRRTTTTKYAFNDQKRSPTTTHSSGPKMGDPKRVEQQTLRQTLAEERPVALTGNSGQNLGSPVDENKRQLNRQNVASDQEEIWRAIAGATVPRDEKLILSKDLTLGSPTAAARSLTKQELAIEKSGNPMGLQPKLTPSTQVAGKSAPKEEVTDLHGAGNSGVWERLNTSSSNNERMASNASDRQSSSSMSNGASSVASGGTTTSNSSGHTFGTSGNRLLLPTTTTTSSLAATSTTFRPDTPTTTATLQVGKTEEEIAPTTTRATSLPSETTKSAPTRTMTTTTTTNPIPLDGEKRQLEPQVDGQQMEELMTLIAQSVTSSVEQSRSQPPRPISDRQVRAEPRTMETVRASLVPLAQPATVAPFITKQQPVEGIGRRQQVTVGPLDNERSVGMASAKNDGRGRLADDLDEYEGSIEDQLAKDALHYQVPSGGGGTRKSTANSYTLKVRHGGRPSQSAAAVDSGKWHPSASDDSLSLANDESGQSSGNPLPGRPGIDYPIHWQVPKTSFDCRNYEQSGFYADVESDCQAYHSCHKGRGGRHTFLCPNGTLFSQELLTCDWWYNVECSASKLYLTNEGTTNSLDSRAQFGDTNNRATTNELSV